MIVLDNITLRRAAKIIVQDASLRIAPGEKLALVGRNGAGKSTLFALLSGDLHEDAGQFTMPAAWRIAQVAQHLPESSESATDFVLAGDTALQAAQAQLAAAEAAEDGHAMALAHSALHDAGAHDARARAQALILGLGFTPAQLEQPVNSFSGGWRMRLQLARALMCPSDVLLLDEPTNHLDLDALVWLEQWLVRYAGTLLIISHDREFLDAICQTTVHVEQAQLKRYSGNYSAFETQRAAQLVLQGAAYAKQQAQRAHLQHFIDRFKAKATKAKQAQSRVKALERMEQIAPLMAQQEFDFRFREPVSLPNPMLSLREVRMGYAAAGAETAILQSVSCSVLAGQRIGILGANGQGKSTLVKTLAGQLPPLGGQYTQGKGLQIGYFAQQELDILQPQQHAMEHMVRLAKVCSPQATEQELRNFLGSFLFAGDMALQPVGSMSGGEKARLVLALIVWQKPNLLLLDEPTNHLDMDTREALALALNDFAGTVLLVSHDRALLRSTCDEFWLVAQGGVQPFAGDLDDYQRYLLDHAKAQREAARQREPREGAPALNLSNKAQREHKAQARQALLAQSRPLKKESAQLEVQMQALSAEQSQLHSVLAANPQAQEIVRASTRLAQVEAQLQAAELRWLEVAEALQAMEQAAP